MRYQKKVWNDDVEKPKRGSLKQGPDIERGQGPKKRGKPKV